MIDHQIHRDQRVDPVGIAAHSFHGGPHRGQIDHGRNAGEVLQDDPGRLEGHLLRVGAIDPARQMLDIVLGDREPVACSQHGFEQDADRIGQVRNSRQAQFLEASDAIDARFAGAGVERAARCERIKQWLSGHGSRFPAS